MATANLADHPLPERQRFGVRIVDTENPDSLLYPEQDHVAQGEPQRRKCAIKIRIDDVFVFLGRVLRVFQRSIRAPVEPIRMLAYPGMIQGALDGEIERDLEVVLVRPTHQPPEIFQGAQVRMSRVMPASLRADRVRASGI